MTQGFADYPYHDANPGWAHAYLLRPIADLIGRATSGKPTRIFEIGAGNGAFASALAANGYDVTGIEYSKAGVDIANHSYPGLRLEQGSAYDDLRSRFGQFPIVLSVEVVEHLYFPRVFARRAFELLESGGTLLVSTPYHGYWKNLALAVSGRLDAHFTALWDGGHIKFWSVDTLRVLLEEAGFIDIEFSLIGRIRPFAKSMIAVAKHP